jgi:hypothetical protein
MHRPLAMLVLRLVLDRMIWDQVQMATDPDWRQSFAREERRLRRKYDQRL